MLCGSLRAQAFTDSGIWLTPVEFSSVAWGDYDNDGDLDIILTGRDLFSQPISKIYQNNSVADSVVFDDADISLMGIANGSAAWGDYDNDGDLDLVLAGRQVLDSKIYRNDNGTFVDLNAAAG